MKVPVMGPMSQMLSILFVMTACAFAFLLLHIIYEFIIFPRAHLLLFDKGLEHIEPAQRTQHPQQGIKRADFSLLNFLRDERDTPDATARLF